MQSRLLRYFLATYNHLNITTAADALCITQPALTKSIHALEADLGVKLFERLPNGVMPTSYGDVLAKHATTIFLEYDHAIGELEAMRTGSAGTIRIAAGPIWLVHILPAALQQFRIEHKGVDIYLEGSVISRAVPALLRGEIDLFCGSLDFPDHPELIKREITQLEHVVLCRRDHPLLGEASFKPASLIKYPWAMLANDDVGRRHLSSYFARNGLRAPRSALESTSIMSILELLQQGDFLACLARPLLGNQKFQGLVEVPGPGVIWSYQAGTAIRNRPHIPSINMKFMDLVERLFRASPIT